MPIDTQEFLKLADQDDYTPRNGNGASYQRVTSDPEAMAGKWKGLFAPHPEGGGAFGGRDNALIKLIAFLRAKSVPFEASLDLCQWWNQRYCDPPLEHNDVHEKVGRLWYEWQSGGMEDETPDDFQGGPKDAGDLELKTGDYLLDLESNGGGLKWLIQNVLVEGGLHYISAPPAGAKSWILISLQIAMTTGREWIGKDVPQCPCLYLDLELGEAMFSTRYKRLGAKRGAPFYYIDEDLKLDRPQDVGRLAAAIKKFGIRLLTIDTLSAAWSGDENDNRQVRLLRSVLKQLRTETGCTILIAHHDRKKRGEGNESNISHERMRGGGDLAAMCDLAYAVDKAGSNLFHVHTTKNRVLPSDEALDIWFSLDDDDEGNVVLRLTDAEERSEKVLGQVEDRIIAFLKQAGRMNTRMITEGVQGSTSAITAALARLAEQERVRVTKEGNSKFYEATLF